MSVKHDHLLGIPFVHGSDDCYGLARRFYQDNFDIKLPNVARPDNWWDLGMDLYMEHFYSLGFRVLEVHPREWLPGDGFLMAILHPTANHCAMYLGDNQILHHPYGRFSEVTLYSAAWRNRTVAVLRHADVAHEVVSKPQFDLMSVLPDHKKRELGLLE